MRNALTALLTMATLLQNSYCLAVPKIAVQLGSVREPLSTHYDETLVSIVLLGFDGVEFANEFGPYHGEPRLLKDKLDALVMELNTAYPRVTQAGFRFGYHNHEGEFGEFNGGTFWDYIASNTPDAVDQLDALARTKTGLDLIYNALLNKL